MNYLRAYVPQTYQHGRHTKSTESDLVCKINWVQGSDSHWGILLWQSGDIKLENCIPDYYGSQAGELRSKTS